LVKNIPDIIGHETQKNKASEICIEMNKKC